MSEATDKKPLNEGVTPRPAFRHVADGALSPMEINAATEGLTVRRQFGTTPPSRAVPPPQPQITDPRDITQFIPKD